MSIMPELGALDEDPDELTLGAPGGEAWLFD
jgi:hypothetical protein